jgi:hypothetical protein
MDLGILYLIRGGVVVMERICPAVCRILLLGVEKSIIITLIKRKRKKDNLMNVSFSV